MVMLCRLEHILLYGLFLGHGSLPKHTMHDKRHFTCTFTALDKAIERKLKKKPNRCNKNKECRGWSSDKREELDEGRREGWL